MSAATAWVLEEPPRRAFPRHPITVPLDLIALRSGVPENLPGRCTDISEAGVGAVVPGEMAAGQQVAVELRLPNLGVPVRARALVRYQSRLHCGLEFVGLSAEQREMIRYWIYRDATAAADPGRFESAVKAWPAVAEESSAIAGKPKRRIRITRRGLHALVACLLALAVLGWWQWQRAWNELEKNVLKKQSPVGESGLLFSPENVSSGPRISSEAMEKRIVRKLDPVYPEAARTAGIEGLVVLDAVVAADGSVQSLRPVSGPDLLVRSSTDAVQSWKFEPYLSSGKPVAVETTIAVEYRLN